MKKVFKIISIFFIIVFLFTGAIIALKSAEKFFKQKRSYDKIYSSQADRILARIIEDSIFSIANSKSIRHSKEENENKSVKDLEKYSLDIRLINITHVCYSKSIYSNSAKVMLSSIGIKSRYADLIEDKKQSRNGEGSSVFLFIKSNKDIIPVFVSASSFDLRTNIDFFNDEKTPSCAKLKKSYLNIKINSTLEDKALLIIQ